MHERDKMNQSMLPPCLPPMITFMFKMGSSHPPWLLPCAQHKATSAFRAGVVHNEGRHPFLCGPCQGCHNTDGGHSLYCFDQGSPWSLGLGHVFSGKLYFAKDIVNDSFVPKDKKSKHVPQPTLKVAP